MGITLEGSTPMTSRNVKTLNNTIITRAVAATAKTPLDIEKKKD